MPTGYGEVVGGTLFIVEISSLLAVYFFDLQLDSVEVYEIEGLLKLRLGASGETPRYWQDQVWQRVGYLENSATYEV